VRVSLLDRPYGITIGDIWPVDWVGKVPYGKFRLRQERPARKTAEDQPFRGTTMRFSF